MGAMAENLRQKLTDSTTLF